jgi:thiamine-phosphate pyrophosphorylase
LTQPLSAERCRLVLVSPPGGEWREIAERMRRSFTGGDIAAAILWRNGLAEADFGALCETLVPEGQAAGIAMIVAGDSRIAGRAGADGVHVEDREELRRLVDLGRDPIVGAGGAGTRHDALEIGEIGPDYILFGRFGHDTRPSPHPRNLALGAWWAELVEIPCVVMAGSDIESVRTVAETGAEFVAVSAAIFAPEADPGEAVRHANRLLSEMPIGSGGQ